jgi:hypothetical protein
VNDNPGIIQVHSDQEIGKTIYWYTCSCGEVGEDHDSNYGAHAEGRQHRREEHIPR